MRTTILLTLFSAFAVPAMAIDHHGTVQADALTWTAPAAYAPGAQLAVVKGDPTKEGVQVKAGGCSYMAKGMTHYAWFTEETVLQLHGTGPQEVTYVNPADDPRKK